MFDHIVRLTTSDHIWHWWRVGSLRDAFDHNNKPASLLNRHVTAT
jgi:hypothetical protein